MADAPKFTPGPPGMKTVAELLPAAIRLHDQLEAEGYTHGEIAAMLGGGFGYSLLQLPPADRALHVRAHLGALVAIGIEIDLLGDAVVRR